MRSRNPEPQRLHVVDRLSAMTRARSSRALLSCALTGLVLVTACEDKAELAPPADGRVNAVMVNNKKSSYADLCDLAPEPGTRPFPWPPLSEPVQATTTRYRWVNVWATWCKPCVEELPLLQRTFDAWSQQKHSVALTLISVDAEPAAATSFIAAHPGTPTTLQMSDPSKAGSWLEQVGLPSGAAIPVHILLDDKSNLLCARAGGIDQSHLERFKQLMFP
jgi:thiol-disulfide isomerase/thioredoxin